MHNSTLTCKDFFKLDFWFMFFLFILLPMLYESEISNYLILLFPLMLIFKLSLVNIHMNIKDRKLVSILIAFAITFLWMLFLLLIHGIEINSIIRIIQFVCCFFCFWYGKSLENPHKHIKQISYLISINIFIIILFALFKIDSYGNFSYIFNNSNSLGSLLFGWIGLLLYNDNKYIIPIFFFLSFVTGTRSLMLCCMIILLFFLQKDKFLHSREKLTWYLRLELFILALFTLYYPVSMNTDLGAFLQMTSQDLLGKNFYSGRDYIWNQVIEAISQTFIVGYGLGVVPNDLFGFGWSTHNLFLQTALQQGIVGSMLLICILGAIYCKLCYMNSYSSYLCAVYILALLIHESFEISLTQNMLASGMMIWTILGIGINDKFD